MSSKSGNPAKRAQEAKRPSSPKDFKKKKGGIFELPSGLFMQLRNPGGMQSLMAAGVMPNSLLGIVQKSLKNGQPLDPAELMGEDGVSSEFITDINILLDHIMVICSVEPSVEPVPENESDRSEDILYVDEVDDEDKMFVFQWITGGTSDLETFRQQHAAGMDALGAVAEAGSAS